MLSIPGLSFTDAYFETMSGLTTTGATTISNAAGVSLVQAGSGATGARTLAQYGMATIIKVNTDLWYISGTGIS